MGHVSIRAWPQAPSTNMMVPCLSLGAMALRPSMFIGDVEPMIISLYICQCHATNEYILNLSVPMNMMGYIRWRYIH
jgi:hypothetical protein